MCAHFLDGTVFFFFYLPCLNDSALCPWSEVSSGSDRLPKQHNSSDVSLLADFPASCLIVLVVKKKNLLYPCILFDWKDLLRDLVLLFLFQMCRRIHWQPPAGTEMYRWQQWSQWYFFSGNDFFFILIKVANVACFTWWLVHLQVTATTVTKEGVKSARVVCAAARWANKDALYLCRLSCCVSSGLTALMLMLVTDERRRLVLFHLQARHLPPQPGEQRWLPVLFLHGRHSAVLQLHLLQRPGKD